MRRRHILASTLAMPFASSAVFTTAWAQGTFPTKPLMIIVPWSPGAATDVTTRVIAEALSKELGQNVLVENRPGANGAIGMGSAARAAPDGYTLATSTADTHSINPHLRSDLPYDANNDFMPLVIFGLGYFSWITRPDFPANSMQELIALAKQKPGNFSYGSWGVGSTAHLAGVLLENATGMKLNHIPFPGAAPALNALQGGHIDMMPYGRITSANLSKAGKVKVFAVAMPNRAKDLANVPTLAELGYEGATAGSWYGITVRKGIPDNVRDRLQNALMKVINLPSVATKIAVAGLDPVNLHGEALTEFMRTEYDRYGAVIRAKKITIN